MAIQNLLGSDREYYYSILSYVYLELRLNIDFDDIIFGRHVFEKDELEEVLKSGLIRRTPQNIERVRYKEWDKIEFVREVTEFDVLMDMDKAIEDFYNSLVATWEDGTIDNKPKKKGAEDTKYYERMYNWHSLVVMWTKHLRLPYEMFFLSSFGDILGYLSTSSNMQKEEFSLIRFDATEIGKEEQDKFDKELKELFEG